MEIIVRRLVVCDGGYLSKTITLEVEQTDTIDTIRSLLAEIEDVPLQQCRLYKRETLLAEGSRPLSDYSIESGDTLRLRIEFQITIEKMSGDTFTMEVDGCDQISIVKLMIGDMRRLPYQGMELIFGVKRMANGCFISDYELQAGSRVQLLMMT